LLNESKFSDLQLDGAAVINQTNLTELPVKRSLVVLNGNHSYNFTDLPWYKPMINLTDLETGRNISFDISKASGLAELLRYFDDLDGGNFSKRFNPGVKILPGRAGNILTGADVGVLGGLDLLSGEMFNNPKALFARLCREDNPSSLRGAHLITQEIGELKWEKSKTINLTYQNKSINFSELAPELLPGAYIRTPSGAQHVDAPNIVYDDGQNLTALGALNRSSNDAAILYGLLYGNEKHFNGYINANRTLPSIAMTHGTYVSNATYDPRSDCLILGIAEDYKTLQELTKQALRPPSSGGGAVFAAPGGGGGGGGGGYRGGETTGNEWGGKG